MTNIFNFLEEKRSVFLTEKQNPIVLKKQIHQIFHSPKQGLNPF